MFRIVLVLCCFIVALFSIPINANVYCIGSCSNPRNIQYEEICCNKDNLGNVVKIPGNGMRHKYISCPSTLSEGCQEPKQIYSNCTEILESNSSATSGYYDIQLGNGSIVCVYCDMNGTNCDGQGGWTRIAYLDMTEPGATCPSGLKLQQYSNIDHGLCGRGGRYYVGCSSTFYSTSSLSYLKVCGRVRGYQYISPEAFDTSRSIDSYYVDGISITQGNPRQHIWTYAAGRSEGGTNSNHCPCNIGNTASTPSFVGIDYYCESGPGETNLIVSDPLWDGEQCNVLEGPCCTNPKMPWFTKSLTEYSSDDIELRVCANSGPVTEEAPIELIELFIK